jgi:hypothetical protein
MRIDAGNFFAGNVAYVTALIRRVRRRCLSQDVIQGIRHEQLLAGDANVLASVRINLRGVCLQPSYVGHKLSLKFACFRGLLGIGYDFHFVRGLVGVANHTRASLERRENDGQRMIHTAPSKAKKRSHAASGQSETVWMERRTGRDILLLAGCGQRLEK